MAATIIHIDSKKIKVEVEINLSNSMLETEENIQSALNDCGNIVTKEFLTTFDTDGSPIAIGNEKFTSKGKVSKKYQTPYNEINIERHVYQNSSGGKVYCPMEKDARIIVGSTPKFAKQISSKYSDLGSSRVQKDLEENHGRHISREFIRNLSEAVSEVIIEKEKHWNYCPPVDTKYVHCVGIGLDGTCMYLSDDGWRIAMVGTIALYNNEGDRLYTQYTASPPEYGKNEFYENFTHDIENIKKIYPSAIYTGVADGAKDNWTYLEEHTENQTLDYFHATEYVSKVGEVIFRSKVKRKSWFTKSCHILKHEKDGAAELLKEMQVHLDKKYSEKKMEILQRSVTYFTNHLHQMNYWEYLERKLPIGSGITEAACKVIIKQRLCNSGMKWKDEGARSVLFLRCISYSSDKWGQTWKRLSKVGF
jgi:hypothetical protein